jgi:hypothetical protein
MMQISKTRTYKGLFFGWVFLMYHYNNCLLWIIIYLLSKRKIVIQASKIPPIIYSNNYIFI